MSSRHHGSGTSARIANSLTYPRSSPKDPDDRVRIVTKQDSGRFNFTQTGQVDEVAAILSVVSVGSTS